IERAVFVSLPCLLPFLLCCLLRRCLLRNCLLRRCLLGRCLLRRSLLGNYFLRCCLLGGRLLCCFLNFPRITSFGGFAGALASRGLGGRGLSAHCASTSFFQGGLL